MRCPLLILPAIVFLLSLDGSALAQLDPGERLGAQIQRTIREAGVVESGAGVEIRSEVPGENTILWVAAEGTQVKPGDELVRIDASAIEKKIAEQRITLANAQVQTESAKAALESLELQKQSVQQTLALQQKANKLTKEAVLGDLGKIQQQIQEANSQIKVGEARVAAVAEQKRRWMMDHGGKGLAADLMLQEVEAQEMLSLAKKRKEYLEKVLRPSEEASLNLKLAKAAMELQAKEIAMRRELAVAKSELEAAEATHRLEAGVYDQLSAAMKACVIKAPQAGTVVYSNVRTSRGATGFIVEAGATVRERQTILTLPDLAKLQVKTLVNETRIAQVRPGQTAVVHVDALPDQELMGVVRRVSRTAEPSTFFQRDVKNYAVWVELKSSPDYLRLGMSAMVEIKTGR